MAGDTYEVVKARVRIKVVDFLGLVFSPTNLVSVSVSIGTVWGIALYESRLVTTQPCNWKFRRAYANHQACVIACFSTTEWCRLKVIPSIIWETHKTEHVLRKMGLTLYACPVARVDVP